MAYAILRFQKKKAGAVAAFICPQAEKGGDSGLRDLYLQ